MTHYADIMQRFMTGEIDAAAAVTQIKALPQEPHREYMLWPEGTFTREYIESKLAELEQALGPNSDELNGPSDR